MVQRIRWVAALAGIAALGLLGAGCSEAQQPSEPELVVAEIDVAAAVEAASEAPAPEVSPERQARIDAYTADAVVSLKRSADFLAAQQSFSFHTEIAFDVLQPNGQMLEFGGTRDVLMRRPDRIRIQAVDGDGDVKELFFDGQSILLDMPGEDAYASVEKPGTVYAAMDYLVEDLGVPGPLEDFVSENYAADLEADLKSGFYLQRVLFDDRICEHLAFRTAEVDVQLWVQEGEQPVPCRVVITYKKADGHPQFAADFHEWNFSPEVDDERFTFAPPESAERLQVQAFIGKLSEGLGGK